MTLRDLESQHMPLLDRLARPRSGGAGCRSIMGYFAVKFREWLWLQCCSDWSGFMLFGDGKKRLARLQVWLTRMKEAMMTGDDYPTWRGLIGPEFDDTPIPSFLRPRPTTDTPGGSRLVLKTIDQRIEWLAHRGLRAHPDVLARREEVAAIVARFNEVEKQKPQ